MTSTKDIKKYFIVLANTRDSIYKEHLSNDIEKINSAEKNNSHNKKQFNDDEMNKLLM